MAGVEHYVIKVAGHISRKRIGQLEDAEVIRLEDGSTLIECKPCDQARLHSLLDRIRDLGLVLVKVERKEGVNNESY